MDFGKECLSIPQVYITEKFEVFFVIEQFQIHKLYKLEIRSLKQTHILDLNIASISSLFAVSGNPVMNQLECLFLICDSHLLFYNGSLSQVCLASNLLKTSEKSFLINASKSASSFVLAQVTQSYGYFKIEEVFVDLDSPDDVVKYWAMDQSRKVLIMLREGGNGT